jgi:solute carrier family 35 (UDP-sugar transporter), member A1/2/3
MMDFCPTPPFFILFITDWNLPTWVTVAFLPAGLYALQNIAALKAYQNLDSLTYNVLNQTKTLSAALCCYFVMGWKQSGLQICSLFLLLLAALIMEKMVPLDALLALTSSTTNNGGGAISIELPDWSSPRWTMGVAPLLLASFISGLTGALSQKSLQSLGGTGRNPYLFSMELCSASFLVLMASLLFSPDGTQILERGFWDRWTAATWIPIISNSMGGIIVGLVTKHAGSVRKGFALIFGMFLSGLLQAWAQPDVGVSKEQIVGGLVASVSLWMHATNPYVVKEKKA